ncbi:DUF418 domain-containing protein [Streptomyces sp. c-19]|uniref:DUF418 domain-containing protein n=1 Tax=Streptomyces sp. c-19 TaxID=2789275 RepID=UPI00397EFDFB
MTGATEATAVKDRHVGRLGAVDALRGFALFGILIVNSTYLASAYHGTGVEDPGVGGPLDDAVRAIVATFFEAKFFLLFSFLFGYAFTLQLASADRARARFVPRFLRRLTGLFLLGVVHAVVLFPGDILTTYAVLGLVLLVFHRIRPRTAVRTAVVLFGGTAAAYALLAVAVTLWSAHAGLDEVAAAADAARAGLGGGAVYAHASLAHPSTAYQILALGVDVITAPLLAAAYAATVLRLANGRHGRAVIAALAPAGRMTLTDYLTQSLACALLFTGYGAGLVGRVPPTGVASIALTLFAAQALASRWWLDRHPYGPAEWGLRAWTSLSWPDWRTGPRRGDKPARSVQSGSVARRAATRPDS